MLQPPTFQMDATLPLCHRMGHRLSYRALTAALWLEEVENGREERGSSYYCVPRTGDST
jgi:hypothetical protein